VVEYGIFRKEGPVATYIFLSTLTDDGRKTIRARPERIEEVNKEIEAMGAKVVDQYAVLGPYDFISIVEAVDNEAVARISIELGARGTVQIMTMPALPISSMVERLKNEPQ
jgi:uncharacterized protein with GYD domain